MRKEVYDRGIIEQFLKKNVKIGVLGHMITGNITGIDDLGVLLLETEGKKTKKRYFSHFNIIEIEEIEKSE